MGNSLFQKKARKNQVQLTNGTAIRRWTPEHAQQVIHDWRASGMSMSKYSREHGLNLNRLWWWQKRLGQSISEGHGRSIKPANVSSSSEMFVPMTVRALCMGHETALGARENGALILCLPGKIDLELSASEAMITRCLTTVLCELCEPRR